MWLWGLTPATLERKLAGSSIKLAGQLDGPSTISYDLPYEIWGKSSCSSYEHQSLQVPDLNARPWEREQEPCSKRTFIPSARQRLTPSSQQGLNPGVTSPRGHSVHQAQSTEWLRTQGSYSCVVTSYLKGERRHVWGHRSRGDDLKRQSVPQRSSRAPDATSWPQGQWMNLREEPGTAGSLRSNYSEGS